MIRRTGLITAVVVLAFALTGASGAEAETRHDAENDKIVCNTFIDAANVSPGLVNGGTAPSVTIKLTAAVLDGCSVTDSADNPVAIAITGRASGKLKITAPNANDCLNLLGTRPLSGDLLVTWKSTPTLRVHSSVVSFTTITGGAFVAPWGAAYGDFSSSAGMSVKRSFKGGDDGASSSIEVVTSEDIGNILGLCATTGVRKVNLKLGQLQLS